MLMVSELTTNVFVIVADHVGGRPCLLMVGKKSIVTTQVDSLLDSREHRGQFFSDVFGKSSVESVLKSRPRMVQRAGKHRPG